MRAQHPRVGSKASKASAAALALVFITVSFSGASAAEIPHENYDLVASDLDMVVALLNASIRASEDALSHMLSEELVAAGESLDLIGTALSPAGALLDQMGDVAESYEELSVLLPPFTDLLRDMEGFLEMEDELLRTRSLILALSDLENMTDDETSEALEAVGRFSSLVVVMGGTLDSMRVSADLIDGLTVDDTRPFVPNELAELIEDLRRFLDMLEEQLEDAVEGDIPWQEDLSFLLLWLARDEVYLGEDLAGGGYLYSDSLFIEGVDVDVLVDGDMMFDVTTGDGGRFSFSLLVPIDEDWLGAHGIQATASLLAGDLVSDTLTFTVTLVPTVTTLEVSSTELSPGDVLRATVTVNDGRGPVLSGAACVLDLDGAESPLTTGEDGSAEWSVAASSLGLGPHSLSARYDGVLPYASSSSGTVVVHVTYPTSLNLTLHSNRFQKDGYLLGTCELLSNGTTPMAGRTVEMAIDGVHVSNYTTAVDGSFSFSYETTGVATGSHVVSMTYVAEGPYWRNASDEEPFTIVSVEKVEYPFFPWLPGWGGGLAEEIPNLFFGENAYYTWLMMLLVLGLALKAMSARKAKRAAKAADEERRKAYEGSRARNGLPMGARKASSLLDRFSDEPPMPHDSIVWHYGWLLAFLRRHRRVALAESMTHWEVAGFLLRVGYPRRATERATALFERAFYSGSGVSTEDAAEMRSSVTEIMDHAGGAGRAG